MRVVDINRISGRGRDGEGGTAAGAPGDAAGEADEVWEVDPRARRGDPTALDAVALAGPSRPGTRPQLVAVPAPVRELEARVVRYRDAGAPSVLRICPGPLGHGYPLQPWALSPLPEYCEYEELAVLVDPGVDGQAYPWEGIVGLARDHPRLVVVALCAPLWGPTAGRALDAAPNLLLETSDLGGRSAPEDVGRLVAAAGAYRLVHGSGDGPPRLPAIPDALPVEAAETVLSGTACMLDERAWGRTHL